MPPGNAATTHQAEADDTVNKQLAQLEDRLVTQHAHHGPHNETEVRELFQRAAQHFADARVRSFLPILIERTVKAKLATKP